MKPIVQVDLQGAFRTHRPLPVYRCPDCQQPRKVSRRARRCRSCSARIKSRRYWKAQRSSVG